MNQTYIRRRDNIAWMRAARLGLAANDGTFGGPEACRTVLRNCEQEMVTRPEPWPWEPKQEAK